jgi:hypothetical protein
MLMTSLSPAGTGICRRDPRPQLSIIERRVVLLSREDEAPPGRFGRAWQRFARRAFGRTIANQLADPRLEALRRHAVLLRISGGTASEEQTRQFVAAGFDARLSEQIWPLCAAPAPDRARHAVRLRRILLATAIWMGILPPVAIELGDFLDDGMIGTLLAGLVFASFAPLVARFR